jgi:hypothetical protein
MKKLLLIVLCFVSLMANAQKDCEYSVNEKEGDNVIKSTKEYLMYQNVFGGTSGFVFFSLGISEGLPVLNFQLLAKSTGFPPAYCLDQSSKIYLQLANGKIVTLLNAYDEQCSSLLYNSDEKTNIRVLTSAFLFTKGSMEELAKSPISFMRVRYSTETVDYAIRKELVSESNAATYFPEAYFMNYLKCIQ